MFSVSLYDNICSNSKFSFLKRVQSQGFITFQIEYMQWHGHLQPIPYDLMSGHNQKIF